MSRVIGTLAVVVVACAVAFLVWTAALNSPPPGVFFPGTACKHLETLDSESARVVFDACSTRAISVAGIVGVLVLAIGIGGVLYLTRKHDN